MILLQILEEEMNKVLKGDGKPISLELDSILRNGVVSPPTIPMLRDKIDVWWNSYHEHNPNFLTSVFYGSIVTCVCCCHCHSVGNIYGNGVDV